MGRLLAGSIAALVLAALLLLWSRSGDEAPQRALTPGAPGSEQESDATTLEPRPGTTAPEPGAAAKPAQPDAEPTTPPDTRAVDAPQPATASDAIRVRVVDPYDAPVAGLPLLLGPADIDPQSELPIPLAEATTDAEGRAVFAGQRAAAEAAPSPWLLVHQVAFEERPRRLLDAAALALDEIVTTQPAWGAAEVTVRDADDRPAPDGSGVTLTFVQPEEAEQPMLAEHRFGVDAQTHDGRARFDWLEPGRELEAHAARPDSMVRSRSKTRPWSVAGATVPLEVTLGADHAVISFRALDPAGRPLPNAPLRLESLARFVLQGNMDVVTDGQGTFRVDVGDSRLFAGQDWLVKHDADDDVRWRGRARFEGELHVGLNDGGDVPLGPDPFLVAGRVVDASGAGVARAEVVAGEQDHDGFFGTPPVTGRTDALGTFELHGILADEEFDLGARSGDARAPTVKARAGQRGVLLVVSPRRRVHGRVVCEPEFHASVFGLTLAAPSGEETSVETVGADQAGAFEFPSVPPGAYELVASLRGETLRTLPGLVVAGEDLDVGTLDLSGLLHRCEVVYTGVGDDAIFLQGRLRWRPSGADEDWRDEDLGQGFRRIYSVEPFVDVRVLARGYRMAALDHVTGRQEARLEPALRVRLELVTDGPLPEYPTVFDAELYADGARAGWAVGPHHFTAQNRTALYDVATTGPVSVRWHLERHGESWAVGGHVLQDRWPEIEVQDVPGEQVFRIGLDGDALRQLLEHPPF
jgi:hypothetical protein